MEKNRFIHYGSVLLIIAAISAGTLAGVNAMTKGVIAQNNITAANNARTLVLPQAQSFDESQAIQKDEFLFIPGFDGNKKVVGYVVSVNQGGYGGNINFSLGIDLAGKVTGLKVMNHQETPGLGAKITGEEWQKLWIGRDKEYKFDKSVDAFAGATVSPNAVYSGIIRTLSAYAEVTK